MNENEINNEQIHVGSKIKVENIKMGKTFEYKIVGSNESNPREGKISDESPIGIGLLGKRVSDVVEIEAPAGVIALKVLEISK